MQFGTGLPIVQQMPGQARWQTGDDPSPIIAVAKKADELGYGWLTCSDHVVIPGRAVPSMGATWYEPATTLSFVAAVTQHVRLLAHVIILAYHSPFDIAKQYATLDRLSGGRVILGVGVGHLRSEFRALGAPYDARGQVTDEYLRTIKTLWTEEEATFHGTYHDFQEVHLSPRPVQQPHPPIWVGGNTRRAARRAVELGDGWVPFEVTVDELRDRLDYARALPAYDQRRAPLEVVLPAGAIELTAAAIDGDRPTFSGSREQILEDVRAYAELGVTGMTVGFHASSLDEQLEKMEQFAQEIMPAFT
ncbi:MAG: LLM class F420-dependent oxidoreductase [Chloroflexi bacterium]|nr:LLM class F420-dependent oxidoreductase [Chloroflexota bacterium]